MSENHRNTAAKVTAELNIHPEDPLSAKAAGHKLHKYDIYGRAAIAEPVITENNTKKEKKVV